MKLHLVAIVVTVASALSSALPIPAIFDRGHHGDSFAMCMRNNAWLEIESNSLSRHSGSSVTLETWFNAELNPPGKMTALLGEVERTQEGTLLGFGLVLHGDQLLLIDGSTSLSTSVPFNQWVHASGIRDWHNKKLTLFLNGNKVGESTIPSAHSPLAKRIYAGRFNDDGDDGFFNGKMAEIRLWDYARTPSEMKKDWNRAISHIAKGLLGLWTMKIKSKVLDEVNKMHNASIHGYPIFEQLCELEGRENGRCIPSDANKRLSLRDPLPDLTVDAPRVQSSAYIERRSFSSSDCAVNEGCTAVGVRRLLRFDTATPNIGTADLELGSPTGSGQFVWDPCHQHYHFNGYASYRLLSENMDEVAVGSKKAFCLMDSGWAADWTGDRSAYPTYTCQNQGISMGWQDVYTADLDCQWIDITGVPSGRYYLEIKINPLRRFNELSFDNNNFLIGMQF